MGESDKLSVDWKCKPMYHLEGSARVREACLKTWIIEIKKGFKMSLESFDYTHFFCFAF